MRDPCPHCGLLKISRSYVDAFTGEILRDIKDHNCPAWVTPPPLSMIPSDTSFIKEAWNTPESLARWRRGIRSGPPDDCECRICTEEKQWQATQRT